MDWVLELFTSNPWLGLILVGVIVGMLLKKG